MRDSKNPSCEPLRCMASEWTAFRMYVRLTNTTA
ncbi:DUF397 domain-containing protein [Sphaerisporangium dianthi]|uniref:DUF397 domain-containing protein n=1 Tax=Sphaerisporangium dianthi TaxID=1436120 RepID=A0ABV9CFP4_9ACTN